MRVIKPSRLRQFWEANPLAEKELRAWLAIVERASWRTPADVKQTFGARADFVKVDSGNTVVVFDVADNNYRLIAAVHYDHPRVFVLRLFDHAEYDLDHCRVMTVTTHLPERTPTSFDALMGVRALRPIADDADLHIATELMDRLAVVNAPTTDQADYLQTLSLLVEAYEAEHRPVGPAAGVSGLDALRYLVEANHMTGAELGRLLGVGAPAASMILSGQRRITVEHARTLAQRFLVDPGLFVRP